MTAFVMGVCMRAQAVALGLAVLTQTASGADGMCRVAASEKREATTCEQGPYDAAPTCASPVYRLEAGGNAYFHNGLIAMTSPWKAEWSGYGMTFLHIVARYDAHESMNIRQIALPGGKLLHIDATDRDVTACGSSRGCTYVEEITVALPIPGTGAAKALPDAPTIIDMAQAMQASSRIGLMAKGENGSFELLVCGQFGEFFQKIATETKRAKAGR